MTVVNPPRATPDIFCTSAIMPEHERHRQHDESEHGDNMQRCGGERADVRQRVFDERLCRPLAHALGALLHTVADAGLLIADPERERAEEHIALGQAVERVDDLAVKELEVRRGGPCPSPWPC